MSRAFDPQGNEYHLEEVQRFCLEQLEIYEHSPKRSFSWPMDRIAGQSYGYTIHRSIVEDWNDENRQTAPVEFHRQWLNNLDNIKKAIERVWT